MFASGSNDKSSSLVPESLSPGRCTVSNRYPVALSTLGEDNQQIRIQLAVRKYNNSSNSSEESRNNFISPIRHSFLKNSPKAKNFEDEVKTTLRNERKQESRYEGVGNFPTIHLKKNAVRYRPFKRFNEVKIPYPDLPMTRFLNHMPENCNDLKESTRSVLDVLQDLSKKKYSKEEFQYNKELGSRGLGGGLVPNNDISPKPLFVPKLKLNTVLTKESTTQTILPVELSSSTRSDCSSKSNILDPRAELRRKLAKQNNEIYASLSSSLFSEFRLKRKIDQISTLQKDYADTNNETKTLSNKRPKISNINSSGCPRNGVSEILSGSEFNLKDCNNFLKRKGKISEGSTSPNKDRLTTIFLDMENTSPKAQMFQSTTEDRGSSESLPANTFTKVKDCKLNKNLADLGDFKEKSKNSNTFIEPSISLPVSSKKETIEQANDTTKFSLSKPVSSVNNSFPIKSDSTLGVNNFESSNKSNFNFDVANSKSSSSTDVLVKEPTASSCKTSFGNPNEGISLPDIQKPDSRISNDTSSDSFTFGKSKEKEFEKTDVGVFKFGTETKSNVSSDSKSLKEQFFINVTTANTTNSNPSIGKLSVGNTPTSTVVSSTNLSSNHTSFGQTFVGNSEFGSLSSEKLFSFEQNSESKLQTKISNKQEEKLNTFTNESSIDTNCSTSQDEIIQKPSKNLFTHNTSSSPFTFGQKLTKTDTNKSSESFDSSSKALSNVNNNVSSKCGPTSEVSIPVTSSNTSVVGEIGQNTSFAKTPLLPTALVCNTTTVAAAIETINTVPSTMSSLFGNVFTTKPSILEGVVKVTESTTNFKLQTPLTTATLTPNTSSPLAVSDQLNTSASNFVKNKNGNIKSDFGTSVAVSQKENLTPLFSSFPNSTKTNIFGTSVPSSAFGSPTLQSSNLFGVSTSQSGPGFAVSTTQSSSGFVVSTTQSGSGFVVSTTQPGSGFAVSTTQSGSGFAVSTIQSGSGFVAATTQSDSGFGLSGVKSDNGFKLHNTQAGVAFGSTTTHSNTGFVMSPSQTNSGFVSSTTRSESIFTSTTTQASIAFGTLTTQSGNGFGISSTQSTPGFGTSYIQTSTGFGASSCTAPSKPLFGTLSNSSANTFGAPPNGFINSTSTPSTTTFGPAVTTQSAFGWNSPTGQLFGQNNNKSNSSPLVQTSNNIFTQSNNNQNSAPTTLFNSSRNNTFGNLEAYGQGGKMQSSPFVQSTPIQNFGATNKFSFAMPTSNATSFTSTQPTTTASSVFTFGSNTPSQKGFTNETSTASTNSTPFAFGNSKNESFNFGNEGPSFGNSSTSTFNFNSQMHNNSSKAPNFNFGNTQAPSSSAFNFSSATPTPSVFSFGGSGSSGSTFSFGTPQPGGPFFGQNTPSPATSFPVPGTFNIGSGSSQSRPRASTRLRRRP